MCDENHIEGGQGGRDGTPERSLKIMSLSTKGLEKVSYNTNEKEKVKNRTKNKGYRRQVVIPNVEAVSE